MRPAVLLDLYDTLAVADTAAIDAGRRRGAERAGVDPGCLLRQWTATVDERSLGALGSPRDELRRLVANCASGELTDGVLDDVLGIEAASWRDAVRLYDDVLPTLDELHRRGCRLALVSNCSWQTEGVVETTGLARALDAVLLSFDVRLKKPDPAILRLALDRLGADPARSLLVDDLPGNLDAARSLGMRGVLIDRATGGLAGVTQAIPNA